MLICICNKHMGGLAAGDGPLPAPLYIYIERERDIEREI